MLLAVRREGKIIIMKVKAKLYKSYCGNKYHLPNPESDGKSLCGWDIRLDVFKEDYLECKHCLRILESLKLAQERLNLLLKFLDCYIISVDD